MLTVAPNNLEYAGWSVIQWVIVDHRLRMSSWTGIVWSRSWAQLRSVNVGQEIMLSIGIWYSATTLGESDPHWGPEFLPTLLNILCCRFQYLHQQDTNTLDVFQRSVQPLVDLCMAGFNTCLLLVGETGSGKSYNMSGLFPLVIEHIFSKIGNGKLWYNYGVA